MKCPCDKKNIGCEEVCEDIFARESTELSCSVPDDLFTCKCGNDSFTFENSKLYCLCGIVYVLSGDGPREALVEQRSIEQLI